MKRVMIVVVFLSLLVGCQQKEEKIVCTLDIANVQDEVTFYSKDKETLTKEVEKIQIKFPTEEQASFEEIAKQNTLLFSMKGVEYKYLIKDNTFTSTLKINYSALSLSSIQTSLGMLENALNEDKDSVLLKKRLEDVYARGYSCE